MKKKMMNFDADEIAMLIAIANDALDSTDIKWTDKALAVMYKCRAFKKENFKEIRILSK